MKIMEKIATNFFLLLILGCNHLFYYPSKDKYIDFKKMKISYENIYFSSLDGTKLHGVLLRHKKNKSKTKGLIVFFHGNGQNLFAHAGNFFWILDFPYDVFIADYRGYGESFGVANRRGIDLDGKAILFQAKKIQQTEKIPRLIFYGQSLGGTLILSALQETSIATTKDVIVIDSSFLSYQKLANTILKRNGLIFLLSPLAYLLVDDDYAPDENKFKSIENTPILVIHGKEDTIVPYAFGEEIYQKVNQKKNKKLFWSVERGEHIDVFFRHPEYRQKFLSWLSAVH